jgi:hypothetical protein
VIQAPLGACGAECALERTNPGLGRLRRKVYVAALAARSEFKHFPSPTNLAQIQSAGDKSNLREAGNDLPWGSMSNRFLDPRPPKVR